MFAALDTLQTIDLSGWSRRLISDPLDSGHVFLRERKAEKAQRIGQMARMARPHDGCTYSLFLQDVAGSHCRYAGAVPVADVFQDSQQSLIKLPATELVNDQPVLGQ